MCTVDDSDGLEVNILASSKLAIGESACCRKCKISKGDVILRGKDVYCRNCFLSYITHKFRACLGKAKVMKPTDHVLVAFSGGQSSAALLHMLWMGTQEESHKKLLYKMSFLYIDEGVIKDQNCESRKQALVTMRHLVQSYGFKIYTTTLSSALKDGICDIRDEELSFDSTADNELLRLFKGTESLTSKEDLLLKLRQNVLLSAAKTMGCNKIFTAEEQTELAIKLLTSIAVGRGEQLAIEVGFQDSRSYDILLLRPMRNIDAKEIAYYNQFNGLFCHQNYSLTTGKSMNCSIRKLTEEFVTGLERDFPSTVSTIFRTGEKLNSSNAINSVNEDDCLLCRGPIDGGDGGGLERPYSTADAILFSQTVSSIRNQTSRSENGCSGSCSCNPHEGDFTQDELKPFFCYGCLLITKELSSVSLLPQTILDEARRRQSLKSMRSQIADFLL